MSGRGVFVKLDVDYPDDPKIIAAGLEAELLYVRGLCLAKRTMSDGKLDPLQLSRMGVPNAEHLAQKLVEVGLWRRTKRGFTIVNWLKHNHSAEQIRELSKKRAAAGSAGGRAATGKQGGGE